MLVLGSVGVPVGASVAGPFGPFWAHLGSRLVLVLVSLGSWSVRFWHLALVAGASFAILADFMFGAMPTRFFSVPRDVL